MERHSRELQTHRHPLASDTRRWLEFLIRQDVTRVDPTLDAHFAYVQVLAKYWLRVDRHLEQEDIPRYAFFPNTQLQPASPVVYRVAPALRFHPATEILLRYLNPRMEVVRVGLAESWRSGLSAVLHQ